MSVNEQNVKEQIKERKKVMSLSCRHFKCTWFYLNLLQISSSDSHWKSEFPCSCTNWVSQYWQDGLEGECNTRYVLHKERNDVYLFKKFRDPNNCKQKIMLTVGIPYLQLFQRPNCFKVRMLYIYFLTCWCGSLSFNGGLSFCKLQIWDPELGHEGSRVPHFLGYSSDLDQGFRIYILKNGLGGEEELLARVLK